MPTIRLTAESIRDLPTPATGQEYYWDSETTGFGVVIGHTGVRSFVVMGRVRGTAESGGRDIRRRTAIGIVGAARPDGFTWTIRLARDEAKRLLGDMAQGIDPNVTRRKPEAARAVTGPTLRDAMDAHVARLEKLVKGGKRSQRTIDTLVHELGKYMADWLDRPIADLTGARLVEIHEDIKRRVAYRRGTNSANDKGAPVANRVVAHVSACWNTLNKRLEGKLGGWNPAKSVDRDTITPKRQRIPDLLDWYARVQTMRSAIRRDGLMLVLYTGLRHEDARHIRWEEVDFAAKTLRRPNPKGGEGAAFTLPISKTVIEILQRRQRDNVHDIGEPDGGWSFPAIDEDGVVGPISSFRQKMQNNTRFPVEDVHSLRREWESIAQEEGVSEIDQHVLSNHAYGSHNVNATYIAQHVDYLAECAETMDAAITRRLSVKSRTGARRAK